MSSFLHPQLQQDCLLLGRFKLSWLLLNKDANYPWFILVPDRQDVSEIYQLSKDDREQLCRESANLSEQLAILFDADKMNIASIGNLVPQLHVHHIVRYKDDIAWPSPVWGFAERLVYSSERLADVIKLIQHASLYGFEQYSNHF